MSSGGGGDDAGDGGRAEWQRIYDRVEALAAGRARLEARNRIQHEFWDARLHQAELSRSRWEAACRELLPSDDPKLAEMLESDLEDSRTCEALLDTENSELLVQLKEVGTCVLLNENTADHEHNSGDLISERRKLKQVYESICSNKDKEATEAVQKFQQKLEELHVAACKKDDEIGRLQAEAPASTNKTLVLEDKLNEMHSLDKANDIQSLKVGQPVTHKHKLAFLSTIQSKEAGNSVEIIQENADHGAIAGDLRAELRKLKQAYETLSSNKDKEISAALAVEDFLLNKLLRMDKDSAGLLKIKEVEAAQANEAAQKLQQIVEELQVAVRYKADEIGRLRAEAGPLKIKEVEAAQANKAVQMLLQNVEEVQVAVRNKDDEIGKLGAEVGHLKIKQVESAQKLQQNVEELQVAVRNKDIEIGRLQAEAGILNIKEVEAVKKFQQNVDVLQVEVRNKDDENCRLRAEAANALKMVLTLEGKLLEMQSLVKEKDDEIQKLKIWQPESLKCKCASSIPVMKISVRVHNGMSRCHSLEVAESDLIYNVKAKLKAEVLFIDDAVIEYGSKTLADSCALKGLHIQEGAQFEVRYPNLIFVKTPTGRTTRLLIDDHFSDTTIYSLKEKIANEIGVAPDEQRLIHAGRQVEDDRTFADYYIQHGSILHVLAPPYVV
ncbi:cingulin-like protein 1 isoform X3 [Triticum urartu]|uniref:cingulin-like protein 1 isoform X3 n=1 Tax=Triticum urartu TaxID=4572 RepID=UPI002042FDA8|nr:cingulin-like protein 1 isoform X3 [Triticum urartu]